MEEGKSAVLYVEDDRDDQLLFMEVLKTVNPEFDCFIATDGEHAFEVLKTIDNPACIYVDVNMPRMNGLEFLRALKLHPDYSQIPVFILTTSNSTNDQLTAMALGAKQYIIKPTSYADLFKILENCCEPYKKLPPIKKAS